MGFEAICGDALVEMPRLIERGVRVDACITDPPYGTTACAWDSVIPFAPMWGNLKWLVKRDGAIVLFGSQPFTSALVMSNPGMFKYQWVWIKNRATGFMQAKNAPLRAVEEVSVFSEADIAPTAQYPMRYNPQGLKGISREMSYDGRAIYGARTLRTYEQEYTNYPRNVLDYPCEADALHDTQKPVELMRYLVRTYTNPGDTVLDFTMGSGTTGVACVIEGRDFIGIEQDAGYCEIAEARMRRASGVPCDIPRPVRQEKPLPLFAEGMQRASA